MPVKTQDAPGNAQLVRMAGYAATRQQIMDWLASRRSPAGEKLSWLAVEKLAYMLPTITTREAQHLPPFDQCPLRLI